MSEANIAAEVRAWRSQRHPVWLYRGVQILLSPLVRLLFWTRRRGHRTVPKKGPVILASNHASNLDPLLVVASMRRPVFHLAKHTLFKAGFWRFFFERLGGQIAVDRSRGGNEAAVQAGAAVLEAGLALGIYPEGGRSPDGRLVQGKTGIARIAYLTGAPIYPVAVAGTAHVWPLGKRLPSMFRRTRILVGPPIRVAKDEAAASDPGSLRELTDRVMYALAAELGQGYDPSRRLPPVPGKG